MIGDVQAKGNELGPRLLTSMMNSAKGAETLDYPFRDAFRLLVLTGCRREEIGQLRWDEIDGNTIRLKGNRTQERGTS